MRNVWVIARREYNQYFSTPVSYAVAFAILLIVGLIFGLVFFSSYNSAFTGGGLTVHLLLQISKSSLPGSRLCWLYPFPP